MLDQASESNIHMFMDERDLLSLRFEIGARLRSRRKELGFTQTEVAAFLGHKSSHRLNQIELGRKRLYADELPRLCNKLDCTLSDILVSEVRDRQ